MTDAGGAADPLVASLRSARLSPAVLKLKLMYLRSARPDVIVLALEGVEDKSVYYQWIRRIRADLEYEPFPCGGKQYVFALREVTRRDLGGLKDGVYFVVDRDYDDMAGNTTDSFTFMTDMYSAENYLVCNGVLIETLKDEFQCHARPDVRERIVALFEKVMARFFAITKEVNRRLFIAKRLGIKVMPYPQKINLIADIALDDVSFGIKKPEEIIIFERDPEELSFQRLSDEFELLDPRTRYRGRFAFLFFVRWLEHLADAAAEKSSNLFAGLDSSYNVRRTFLRGNFASKSTIPLGFESFVLSMTPPSGVGSSP